MLVKHPLPDPLRYAMVIVWSEEDDCYLVHLPDFPEQTYRTHGDNYEEAARNGEEVLQLLLEEDGLPLPKPRPSAA
jgi:predicted RNase H-like HicB family nuclease